MQYIFIVLIFSKQVPKKLIGTRRATPDSQKNVAVKSVSNKKVAQNSKKLSD
jgi:hypothetical protein